MGPRHKQEDSWKVQARDEDAQSREAVVVEKWSDSVQTLMQQPIEFAGGLDVGFVEKKKKKHAQVFDLSTWKARAALDSLASLAGFL